MAANSRKMQLARERNTMASGLRELTRIDRVLSDNLTECAKMERRKKTMSVEATHRESYSDSNG